MPQNHKNPSRRRSCSVCTTDGETNNLNFPEPLTMPAVRRQGPDRLYRNPCSLDPLATFCRGSIVPHATDGCSLFKHRTGSSFQLQSSLRQQTVDFAQFRHETAACETYASTRSKHEKDSPWKLTFVTCWLCLRFAQLF